MSQHVRGLVLLAITLWLGAAGAAAAEPLHARIDALIAAGAKGQPASPAADDAEFLRRVYLDLAGRIPSVHEARAFLQDPAADKRARLVEQLLGSAEYPRRMQELFHVMLMERLGDDASWEKYLRTSFEANKPWDQLAREILCGSAKDEQTHGATFFYTKRLENYGQNPVDYPALTRDVGRLFLGMDLRCAQCHDHIFIAEYAQQDFQGLFAFFQNTALQNAAVVEKPTTEKLSYMSVFRKIKKETGPRIPGLKEIAIPAIKKGEEYLQPPDRKTKSAGVLRFSPLQKLAEELPTAENPAFVKNIANRLWFVMMGRGLVQPLDLFHSANPPTHPELLDLLAEEFIAHKFDIKWMLRELALSQTYQRSSLLPSGAVKVPPESFLVANEKRLSAEQLLSSMRMATGESTRVAENKDKAANVAALRQRFLKAFANPRREPEEDFNPSLQAALFMLNDETVLGWLNARPGNLVDRLEKLSSADAVAEELYLSVLTRYPTAEERADVVAYLDKNPDRRAAALGHLAWALLASTEFCVNH